MSVPTPSPRDNVTLVVAGREIAVKLTDRNFVVSTIVTVVLVVASFAIQVLVLSQPSTNVVGVVTPDAQNLVAAARGVLTESDSEDTITIASQRDEATALTRLAEGSIDAYLRPAGTGWQVVGQTSTSDDLVSVLQTAATEQTLERLAASAGTTAQSARASASVTATLVEGDPANTGFYSVTGFLFAFLFYMASLVFGMAIASSVIEEKQSRVVEILASAIPISSLLAGKLIGNSVLALGQLILFVAAGLAGLSFTPWSALLPAVAGAAGWFVVFFLVGFVALACLWAMAGALATRNEDLQSTTTPISTVLICALFGGLWLEGTWQVVGSYVPIVSSIAMPRRMLEGSAMWWEPVISIAITLAVALVTIRVGAVVYRRALLQTRRRMSIREALRAED